MASPAADSTTPVPITLHPITLPTAIEATLGARGGSLLEIEAAVFTGEVGSRDDAIALANRLRAR